MLEGVWLRVDRKEVDPNSDGSRGGAHGARVPRLFLDQTEAWRAEKFFFWDRAPPVLTSGPGDRPPPPPPPPPPPHLKV